MHQQSVRCPNCGRRFNCAGSADCWCLQVDRVFDYEEMILRTGNAGCVCPVCLTGRAETVSAGGASRQQRAVRDS